MLKVSKITKITTIYKLFRNGLLTWEGKMTFWLTFGQEIASDSLSAVFHIILIIFIFWVVILLEDELSENLSKKSPFWLVKQQFFPTDVSRSLYLPKECLCSR